MGKYDKVVDGLPDAPAEDQKRQDKINRYKEEVKAQESHTPASMTRAYKLLRVGTGPDLTDEMAQSLVDWLSLPRPNVETLAEALIKWLGKDGLEDLLSIVQLRIDAYQQMLAQSFMEDDAGWGEYGAQPNMVRLKGGGSLTVGIEPQGKVEDKQAFRRWCIENGYENELQLHAGTMNGMVKDRVLAGIDLPDGVKVFKRYKITLRKGGDDDE